MQLSVSKIFFSGDQPILEDFRALRIISSKLFFTQIFSKKGVSIETIRLEKMAGAQFNPNGICRKSI